jgi:hypothetical protein
LVKISHEKRCGIVIMDGENICRLLLGSDQFILNYFFVVMF